MQQQQQQQQIQQQQHMQQQQQIQQQQQMQQQQLQLQQQQQLQHSNTEVARNQLPQQQSNIEPPRNQIQLPNNQMVNQHMQTHHPHMQMQTHHQPMQMQTTNQMQQPHQMQPQHQMQNQLQQNQPPPQIPQQHVQMQASLPQHQLALPQQMPPQQHQQLMHPAMLQANAQLPASQHQPLPQHQQQSISFQQSFCSNIQPPNQQTVQQSIPMIPTSQPPPVKFQPVDPNTYQYQLQQQIANKTFINQKQVADNKETAASSAVPTTTANAVEIPKDDIPKYIEGMLALCKHCGYMSQDFNKCERCKRKLDNPKAILKDGYEKKSDVSENSNNGESTTLSLKTSLLSVDAKKILQKLDLASKSGAITLTPTKKVAVRRSKARLPEPEPEILTLSSDDEDHEHAHNVNNIYNFDNF